MYDIVIPTYNLKGANMVASLIESISMFDNKSLSNIIISDDGSDISTLLKLNDIRNTYKNVKLIFNERLHSFSKTVNAGMKLSNTNNNVLLLNNDMLALTSFEPFVNFMKTKNNIGIISGKLLYPNNTIQSVGLVYNKTLNIFRSVYRHRNYNYESTNYPKKYISVIGACQYINRNLINKIGYYDENYILGAEDTDYCINAQYNNYEVWYIPDVKITHYGSSTRNDIYKKQNEKYLWEKWSSLYNTIRINQGISNDTLDKDILMSAGLIGLGLKFI